MSDKEPPKYYNEKIKKSIYNHRDANRARYNEIARDSYRKRMKDPQARAHWNETCRINSKKWREKKRLEKEKEKAEKIKAEHPPLPIVEEEKKKVSSNPFD